MAISRREDDAPAPDYEVKVNVRLAQLVPPHLCKARLTASEIEELKRAIGWR